MDFEDDYMELTSDVLSKMRLMMEGAVALFENEVCPVYKQIRETGESAAMLAFDDIGTALYELRRNIQQLQEAHHQVTHQQAGVQKTT